jgi:PilZ domain-containing protein
MSPRGKQQEARYRRRLEVRFGDGVNPPGIGYSGNLSAQGMMIRTPRVYAPGTELDLELRFAGGTLKLRGRVMWAREGPMVWISSGRIGMGIRFIDPPENLPEMMASGPAYIDPARRTG